MGIVTEFKEFAAKGNVVDMAVGFILGGAFSTIVKSLVNDVIMPPIGLLLGGVDFSNLKLTLKDAVLAEDGSTTTEAVAISYGLFINNVISFFIVALALFFLIKGINSLKRKQEEEVETPEPEPEVVPADVQLLGEIRDLLAKK